MKKILTLTLVLILCLSFINTCYADDDKDTNLGMKSSVEGFGTSEDTNLYNIKFELKTIMSDSYIKSAGCSIQDLRNEYAYIAAYTETNTYVDSLNMYVYLQRWNGSYWISIESWTKSVYLSDSITFNTSYKIISGEKYRVKTIHSIDYQGEIFSTESITSYIIAE